MRRLFAFLLLCGFGLALMQPAEAAVKKKKAGRYRRIVRDWPKGGPRPVFPKEASREAAPPAVTPPPAAPAPPKRHDSFFAEGGLAGGGLAAEFGYRRALNDKVNLSGAAGYLAGGDGSAFILDLIRVAYIIRPEQELFAGGGLNFARGMFGLEIFGGKRFGRWSVRAAGSGVVGWRAGLGCDF
ncbi:MAG: hypothetical protein JW873_02090 [Candidatus Saganbacteria bacterium]|nr:hypothetical protein [Candidatus Saganbacteria bacterium]